MSQFRLLIAMLIVGLLAGISASAAKLQVLLPLNRTAYQTNELIDISVVRSDVQALPAGLLTLTVTGDDASKMTFAFPVKAVLMAGADARNTEKLRLNGWLMRPGAYTVDVACDGAAAQTKIEIFSHIRKSDYKTIHWGGITNKSMITEGENGMGFNIAMGETGEPSIRSGLDVMGNCLMGGGHQHDLKLTNDWSDPNVYIGAIQRGVDRAFGFRTMPNAIGAHLHDEPGLTWLPHAYLKDKDGKPLFGPHDISFQRDAYKRAFGEEMPWFDKVDTNTPEGLEAWAKVCEFKLGFMDMMWKASKNALDRMKPGYLSVTQTQYGWTAFHDGYYFNVARSMPIISGHGGYNDFWLRNLNATFFLEMALPRQTDKPTWYLPEWYNMTPDAFREEHNLSFITGIQGMSTPPGLNATSAAASGITESNKLFARLGTIFTKPAITRQDVAVLYSKSCIEHSHGGSPQLGSLPSVYMALKMNQYPMSAVLDEDIIDGTLAVSHKAIILTGLDYLDPAAIASLELYTKTGGVVLITSECKINVVGAVKLDILPGAMYAKAQADAKLVTDKDQQKIETTKANSFRLMIDNAAPLAKMLKDALVAKGIFPAFESDVNTIAAGKQVRGDIEYIFAVNYTPEAGYSIPAGGYGIPVAAKANIALPNDGRSIYNAISGGLTAFSAKKGQAMTTAALDFGPGQMMAFARTARPIGGVNVGAAVINRDLTRDSNLQTIDFSATLQDTQKNVIAGTAPLQIKVIDPLGVVRYDIYRATDKGVCSVSLPLAVNDAAGKWTISVKELLANTTGTATFTYMPASQCGVLAGAAQRATYFWADKENIYNFFRNYRVITIVKGTSDYNNAAADRLVQILKPYNVVANIVTAADANKARTLTDEEAKTWCGDQAAGSLDVPANINARNSPAVVGYNLSTPTILLGNEKDNPLIKFLNDRKVLPYAPTADFPGRGHGMIAWNLMTLGHDVESISLIGYDADGINEAIGTMFTLGIGIDPLTPLVLPVSNTITTATQPVKITAAPIEWQAQLTDRINSIAIDGNKVVAYSANGAQATIDTKGKATIKVVDTIPAADKPVIAVAAPLKSSLLPGATVKMVVAVNNMTAIAYTGGTVQTFGADNVLKTQQTMPTDINALAWNGNILAVGLADGCVVGLNIK
ncbi:MAG: hypothetical protein WCO98_00105 [bacterium]